MSLAYSDSTVGQNARPRSGNEVEKTPIELRLDHITHTSLSNLHQSVAALAARLDPVCPSASNTGSNMKDDVPRHEPSCSLEERLIVIQASIESVVNHVGGMLNRLKL